MPRQFLHTTRMELDPHEAFALASGFGWFLPLGRTPEDLEAAWRLAEVRITTAHAQKFPGSRPWAWWHWTAPEPRKCFSPPHTCGRLKHPRGRELYYGLPAIYYQNCADCWNERHESPAAFLRRLHLLLPEESLIVPKGTDACDRWFERTYPDEDNPILDRRSCNRLVRELAGGV